MIPTILSGDSPDGALADGVRYRNPFVTVFDWGPGRPGISVARLTRRAFLKAGAAALFTGAQARRGAAGQPPLVVSIEGAIVSTSDIRKQRDFFEGGLGLRPVAVESLSAAQVEALWGVSGHSAQTALLETPGTGVGVRLVQFEPAPSVAIREGAAGVECDALKGLDFTVSDWERGLASLRARGYDLAAAPAEYTRPGMGRLTEGHVHGPDGVVAALLAFHDSPRSRFVRAVVPLFSELLSVSATVAEPEPVRAFYSLLGLEVVSEYAVESESLARLAGAARTSRLAGRSFGLSQRAPMLGVVHHGLPSGACRSLRERSKLPNRGAAAVRLRVRSAALAEAACRKAGYEVLAREATVRLLPDGEVRSLTVRAPHGVVHHLLERRSGRPG